MKTRLHLENIGAGYDDTEVLHDLTLDVEPGELLAVLGPSGCGKTTLLKVVAGLVPPRSGSVVFDGEPVNHLPAEQREAAMVFQKPLLFPYLNVGKNVGFGLKMRHASKSEVDRQVADVLAMVRMQGYQRRRPSQLSGGQEQRVALARALVTSPRILLLDEPFSALDEDLRSEMRTLLRGVQRQLGITTLFVTHDQQESVELADRIAILLEGRIEQVGRAREFFTSPASVRVARFFGWQLLPQPGGVAAFRPERARVAAASNGWDPSSLQIAGSLLAVVDLGTRVRCTVRDAFGNSYLVEPSGSNLESLPQPGAEVVIHIPKESVKVWEGSWNPSTS